jgi:hypothetical protein
MIIDQRPSLCDGGRGLVKFLVGGFLRKGHFTSSKCPKQDR